MKRGSNSPCPACGKTVNHPVDGICYVCRSKLDDVIELTQKLAEFRENGTVQAFQFSSTPHWNAYPHLSLSGDAAREYQVLLRNLVVSVAEAVLPFSVADGLRADTEWLISDEGYNQYVNSGGQEMFALKAPVAAAVRALDAWVREVVPAAYDDGKAAGTNVLLQLATGAITLDELNQEAAPRDQKGRR